MLCCRRISAIGTPVSPCFRMPTIWFSVNRDFRMGISLAPESLPSNCLPRGEAYERTGRIDTYDRRSNRTGYGQVDPRTGQVDFFDLRGNRTGSGTITPS